MNCKQGDLAYTVPNADTPPHLMCNAYRIVTVNEFVGRHTFPGGPTNEDVWRCEPPSPMVDAGGRVWSESVLIPDKNLRPIRDSNGDDETLTWVGKPEQVAA